MGVRLHNPGRHPIRVELRGGKQLYLESGQTSPPLRRELLYDNPFVTDWIRRGLLQERDARWEEVLEAEYQDRHQLEPVSRDVTDIPGIGTREAKALKHMGISTAEELGKRGERPQGIKDIGEETEARPADVKRWLAAAKLSEIPAIKSEEVVALVAAGVDSAALADAKSTELAALVAEGAQGKGKAAPITAVRAGELIAAARVLHARAADAKAEEKRHG
jgi:hypothetical protein